jgi:hypothetical protein
MEEITITLDAQQSFQSLASSPMRRSPWKTSALRKGSVPSFISGACLRTAPLSQGRYSFVGAHPSLEVVAKEELVTVLDHANGTRDEKISEDPLQIPVELSEDWRPATVDGLPNCFCGERKHERSPYFVCLVQSSRI